VGLGYDGIWFGIMVVKMIELGLITPPLGLNVFVIAGVAEDLKVEDAFAGITPFALLDILTVVLLLAFPAIVLWLPGHLG
jgi:C4-dicarboxylate transporter, DctM subunit